MKQRSKNRWKHIALGAVAGAVLGFVLPMGQDILMYLNSKFSIDMIRIMQVVTLIASLTLTLLGRKPLSRFKEYTQSPCDDNKNIKFITDFHNASMYLVIASTLSCLLIALSLINMLNSINFLSDISLYLFFIGGSIALYNNFLIKKTMSYYPYVTNSDVQVDFGEKNIMTQIINNIDEGERLVMLHSLYKSYQSMINISLFSLLVLGLYQSYSHQSQLLAMFCVTIMLVYSTYVYYKKSKEFNK